MVVHLFINSSLDRSRRNQRAFQCWIFENGLLCDQPFRMKLGKKKVKNTQEMLNLDQSYITLEEKLNTHYDNPTFATNEKSERPTGK